MVFAFSNVCSTCATKWGIFPHISEKDERRVKMTAGVSKCSELMRSEPLAGVLDLFSLACHADVAVWATGRLLTGNKRSGTDMAEVCKYSPLRVFLILC